MYDLRLDKSTICYTKKCHSNSGNSLKFDHGDDEICAKFCFMERGFFCPIVQNESPRILTKERGIWTNWVLSAWLFIKGYRWVKNDGNEMLKLYRVIYPESWSQLWLLTVWLIVIKWASYESNGYGGKITKHRTKPLHIRHLFPLEFKSRKIIRPLQPKRRSAITPQVFV